jgi:DNA modification methylase
MRKTEYVKFDEKNGLSFVDIELNEEYIKIINERFNSNLKSRN